MSDLLDIAQENEERHRKIALHNAVANRSDVEIVEDMRNGRTVRVCAECDEEIPAMRIIAMPSAALCIECQELWERKL